MNKGIALVLGLFRHGQETAKPQKFCIFPLDVETQL
jgi:hypothetical protein